MVIQDEKLKQTLDYARFNADEGRVELALTKLNEAREYAAEIGTRVPKAKYLEIEETAYRRGAEAALELAMWSTVNGMNHVVTRLLSKAEEYAAEIDLDIRKKVSLINEVSLAVMYDCIDRNVQL